MSERITKIAVVPGSYQKLWHLKVFVGNICRPTQKQ